MDDGLISALRDNIVQKQAIIDKLVTENAQLREILKKFTQEIKTEGGKNP